MDKEKAPEPMPLPKQFSEAGVQSRRKWIVTSGLAGVSLAAFASCSSEQPVAVEPGCTPKTSCKPIEDSVDTFIDSLWAAFNEGTRKKATEVTAVVPRSEQVNVWAEKAYRGNLESAERMEVWRRCPRLARRCAFNAGVISGELSRAEKVDGQEPEISLAMFQLAAAATKMLKVETEADESGTIGIIC